MKSLGPQGPPNCFILKFSQSFIGWAKV
jgi:hypothetical protein